MLEFPPHRILAKTGYDLFNHNFVLKKKEISLFFFKIRITFISVNMLLTLYHTLFLGHYVQIIHLFNLRASVKYWREKETTHFTKWFHSHRRQPTELGRARRGVKYRILSLDTDTKLSALIIHCKFLHENYVGCLHGPDTVMGSGPHQSTTTALLSRHLHPVGGDLWSTNGYIIDI